MAAGRCARAFTGAGVPAKRKGKGKVPHDPPTPASEGWRLRRPRLTFGVGVGLATYVLLLIFAPDVMPRLRFIAAWDVGATTALLAIYQALRKAGPDEMKQNALRQDAGQWAVLILTLVAATASLVVIATEVPLLKAADNLEKYARAVLVIFTIALSWGFIQTIFAVHYAHDYFLDLDLPRCEPGDPSDRLVFPGGRRLPTYGDFLYFSFTIGMTFQVSDVQICDPSIRRVVLIHSVAAFFYTTGILALSVNLVAGLV
jgi:uncharacterized membrane protein